MALTQLQAVSQGTQKPVADGLEEARAVLTQAAAALASLAASLGDDFVRAQQLLAACQGHVVVTGVGKSGLIGQKISSTLASTGCPSFFVHASEAVHGDLGRILPVDVVLALSNSGESQEVLALLAPLRELGVPLVALVGRASSTLARRADAVVCTGPLDEACPMGLVPTTSTTAMLALGDALAMGLMARRQQVEAMYARLHPGGSLGRKMQRVAALMRHGDALPLAPACAPLREVLAVMTETPGRPGAAILVEPDGTMAGLFTDGDLRRLLKQDDFSVDAPISDVMHRKPLAIGPSERVTAATALLRQHGFDQVPVVDELGRPIGLLDVQDILAER